MGILSKLFRGKTTEKTPSHEPPAPPQPTQVEPATVNPEPPAQEPAPAPAPPPPPKPDTVDKVYKVTGINHYLDNLLSLASDGEYYHLGKRDIIDEYLTEQRLYEYEFFISKVELVPEPDNPHDPKAIKVLLDGLHIGYIKAGSCAHLLKAMREDRIKEIECQAGGGRYKKVYIEDYTESGKEIYTLDKDTAPWFVHLTITEKK